MSFLDQKIINLGFRAAMEFNVRVNSIVVTDKLFYQGKLLPDYGFCDLERADIYIRTHTYHEKPRLLIRDTIQDTLAHELAHLIDSTHKRYHTHLTYGILFWLRINWDRER